MSATAAPAHQQLTVRVKDPEQEHEEKRPAALDLKLFARLFSYSRPYARTRNTLFFLVILRGCQIPTIGYLLSAVINGPISAGDVAGTFLGALGFIAFVAFTEVCFKYRQLLALQFGEAVIHDLRAAVFNHLLRQPMSYFGRMRLGRLISRVTSDIEALRAGVQNVLFVSLVQLFQMLGAAAFMLWSNWKLFLVILLMTPILWGLNRYFGKRIAQASREVQESFSRVTSNLAESVKGIKVTQGFGREAINAGIFRRLVEDHGRHNLGAARQGAVYLPLLELNSQFFIALLLLVGSYGMLHAGWAIRLPDLITFFFLANIFFAPIQNLGNQYTQALAAMAGAERVFSVLDTRPDWEDAPGAGELETVAGRVEFQGVTFGYDPAKPVLHAASFAAAPGQMIALVGHTGSGKSTIINLLAKFWLPQQGRILIDGRDLQTIHGASWHRHLGAVLQTSFLFSGTVRENIRLGRPSATAAEIEAAVRALDCLDLVEAMQDGFETRVNENGAGLSLGQRQLVAFARAFLADPRILLLDEATSSLDTITEARLQKALAVLMRGRTSFVVAHRLSTIRKADQVLVLQFGKIVEQGSHEQLLEQDGIYANLYRQFIETE